MLRLQLSEISEYYNGEKLLKRKELDEMITHINGKVKQLSAEYFIDSRDESEEATRLYTNFYDKLDEKSIGSKNSFIEEDEDFEEGDINKEDNEKIDKMIKDYYHDVEQADEVLKFLSIS